jgi:hypothetical protein
MAFGNMTGEIAAADRRIVVATVNGVLQYLYKYDAENSQDFLPT